MITAAGAGASFCTVTPARLRPKTPKSSRGLQPQQHPPLPLPQTQQHQALESAPPPFLHNLLLHRTNSAPTSANSVVGSASPLDYPSSDDWYSVNGDRDSVTDDSSLFSSAHSPTSPDFLESPSPKSFYSVATSSSGDTARGVPPPNFDELLGSNSHMDQYYFSQQDQAQMMWTNNPTDNIPLSTSPETSGFFGAESDQSPRRSTRRKISSRDPSVRAR